LPPNWGISFDNEKFKIDEVVSWNEKVNLVGKIITLFPVRLITSKNGTEGGTEYGHCRRNRELKTVLWTRSI